MATDDRTEPKEIPVCCLACGLRYRKPLSGTVASANPGCPACGYLGWTLDREAEAPTAPRVEKRA